MALQLAEYSMFNDFILWLLVFLGHSWMVQSDPVCNLCVWKNCLPKVEGVSNFNVEDTAQRFINLCRKNGGKEARNDAKSMLASLSEPQRLELDKRIRDKEEKSMLGTLGQIRLTDLWFERLVVSLATPLHVYLADILRTAIKKQDRKTVLEIYTMFPGCLIRDVNSVYNQRGDLKKDITDAFTQNIGTVELYKPTKLIDLILSLSEGKRDSHMEVNQSEATKTAEEMSKAMEKFKTEELSMYKDKWESIFKEVFTKKSFPQLKEIIAQYESLRGKDSLYKDLFDKDIASKIVYNFIATIARNQHTYFVEELKYAINKWMKLPLTYQRIIFIIRSRYNIDMKNIIDSYYQLYHVHLKDEYSKFRFSPLGNSRFKAFLSTLSTE